MTRHARFPLYSIAAFGLAASTMLVGCTPNDITAATSSTSSAAPASSRSSAAASSGISAVRVASPVVGTGGCRSLTASNAVQLAVAAAYKRVAQPSLTHIAPKGTIYYGVCGGTAYAAARFQPTSGATQQELIALQDGGAATKYFTEPTGKAWRYVASDGFPRNPRGCAVITQIPAQLATAWANCLEG